MNKTKWIATKKEYEVDAQGKPVLKKFTSEPKKNNFEKKDLFDLVFRTIGLLAIGLPIYMISVQQRAAIRSDRAKQQSEIYQATATEFRLIQNKNVNSPMFQRSLNRISDTLVPRIAFWFNNEISDKAEEINKDFPLYKQVVTNIEVADSLFDIEADLGSYLGHLGENISAERQHDKKTLDTLFFNFADYKNSTGELVADREGSNSSQLFLRQMDTLNNNIGAFHNRFKSNCDAIMNSFQNGVDNNYVIQSASLREQIEIAKKLKPQTRESFRSIKYNFFREMKLKCDSLLYDMRSSNKLYDQ